MLLSALVLIACAGGLAAAIALGGPKPIQTLASVQTPFEGVDFSGMPKPQYFTARDGTPLAWYRYPATGPLEGRPHRRVVLVHGSSSRARSMHILAQALAAEGLSVATLDMRGHGDSGARGQVTYVGQLDDDLEDFMRNVPHDGPQTLMGFSAGGGFALRIAGGSRQSLFDRYVLLAPFIHVNAATARPDVGGWASVGVPRLVALTLFNRLGIARWNDLPVLRFALDPSVSDGLTPSYSYSLAVNFRPHQDYRADIRNARGTVCVLAGQNDEIFYADRYADVFSDAGKAVPVTLLPGVNHMGLTLQADAVRAIAQACNA